MKYEIGQRYNLPCVKLQIGKRFFWFVILDSHLGEISGEWHRHVDIRFTSDYVLEKKLGRVRTDVIACGMNEDIVNRRMVCKHEYVPIQHRDRTRRFNKLLSLCQGMKLDTSTMKCPHQGCDLSGLKGQNSVVCPCHGLEWSLKDGSLQTSCLPG